MTSQAIWGAEVRANAEVVQAIRKAVIGAKIALSSAESAKLQVMLPDGQQYAREITRVQFEQLIAPVIARTAGPGAASVARCGARGECDRRGGDGGRVYTDSGGTGAGCRPVRRAGWKEGALHTELNPDEVVALGAAVQAQILSGASTAATEDLLLLDVTPLSLGIEALGGVVAKVIQRNSTIPASATEHFTTGVDGQTKRGHPRSAGRARNWPKTAGRWHASSLKGIPPMVAGLPRIEVKFLIDANGILKVSAREQRSGQAAEIDVKPTYGLTDEQVETMILDSFDNAEQGHHRAAGDRGEERGADDSGRARKGEKAGRLATAFLRRSREDCGPDDGVEKPR